MQIEWSKDIESRVYKDALMIRKQVFIEEQGVDEAIEIDGLEEDCLHGVGYIDHQPVVTARIHQEPHQTAHIQRVAVLKPYRGKNYGKEMVEACLQKAKELGNKKASLGAQNYAIPFYEKCGFHVEGEEFLNAGMPHHQMTCQLSDEK